MFLTETHIQKLRDIASDNGWRVTRALRNVVYINASDGDFQTRVQVRRNNEGSYDVTGTLGCVFNGTEDDFVGFTNTCLAQSLETAKVRRLTQEYLTKEVAACTPLKAEYLEIVGRIIMGFPGWLDPIYRIYTSDRGLTAVDPVSHSLFEGSEDIDLALQGGRLEVDSEPDNHVVVWISRDYLYPLAKQISGYLTAAGMTSTVSTAEVFFEG